MAKHSHVSANPDASTILGPNSRRSMRFDPQQVEVVRHNESASICIAKHGTLTTLTGHGTRQAAFGECTGRVLISDSQTTDGGYLEHR